MLKRIAVSLALVAGILGSLPPAHATYHFMVIGEIFVGHDTHADVEYIELEMLLGGQNNVAGTEIEFYDASGTAVFSVPLTGNVATGNAGSSILIGTSETGTELFNVTPDFTFSSSNNIPTNGGAACFRKDATSEEIDCVAWGNFTGDPNDAVEDEGTPFAGGTGLVPGSAIDRDGAQDPSATPVDTDESTDDFDFAPLPSPKTNGSDAGIVAGGALGFTGPSYEVFEGDVGQTIELTRNGNATGTATANLMLEDVSATNGADYTVESTNPISMGDGVSSGNRGIVIEDDDEPEGDEIVLLRLREPGANNVLARPNARLIIHDNEEITAPLSAITRPEHRRSYDRDRLRRIKGTAEETTFALDRVQVSLRKKMRDGTCRWWNGKRFAQRACSRDRWLRAEGLETWSYDIPRLGKSVGTRTKNYTAFSRAVDVEGQREPSVELGRNWNSFEVT